ncbi:MAG: guanylate kinase [Myxococcota bacterium]
MTERAGARGRPFVIAAPSGTGKTTVCRALLERDPRLRFSVSHTTRKPRENERDGIDYHFVDNERFRELVTSDAFLEYAEYGDNLYGTSWEALESPLAEGWDLLVEIEVKGARQFRERRRDACFIFLLPPEMPTLRDRLRDRGTDTEETIAKRLAIAEQELEAIEFFDYAVVNDDLDTAVGSVLDVIEAERIGQTAEVRERYARSAVFKAWRRATDPEREAP